MLNLNDIIYEIFCQLGLEIDQNTSTITYQGNRLPVLYNNKTLKYNFNGPILIDRSIDMWFDPINNRELCEKLFQVYIKELYDCEQIRFINSKFITEDNIKYAMVSTFIEDDEKVEKISRYYRNIGLCYLDSILDYMYDLSQFDI